MAKEDIKQNIVGVLLDLKEPCTLSFLADRVGISSKSVRNYLDELERPGILGTLRLIRKQGVGIYLEGDEEQRTVLKQGLGAIEKNMDGQTHESRQQYIIRTLLKNRDTYTIQLLADDLYVSKGTIVHDLACVEKWLERRGLKLRRKPNRGLWVEGDEFVFRRAMLDLYAEVKEPAVEIHEQEIEDLDYRIDFGNFNKVKKLFPRLNIYRLQSVLQQAEQQLDYCLTDEAFINLIVHIAITVDRVKQDKEILMEQEQLLTLSTSQEFAVAKWIVDQMAEMFGICLPLAEAGYISLHLLGARVQRNVNVENLPDIMESENQEYIDFAQRIIDVVGAVLNIDLSQDRLLLIGLALHLRPAILRIRHGMQLRNPMLERMKREYTSIFGAAWAASGVFEKMFGITVDEDEVGYIAMHIGAAVERVKRKIKTVVVCSSGMGTSQLIAVKLGREFPEIEVIEITSAGHMDCRLADSADLIVSTIPLKEKSEKVVCISTLIGANDIAVLRAALKKIKQNAVTAVGENLLCKIVSEELCFTDIAMLDKQAVIAKYCRVLEQQGYVSSEFVNSALQREEITSTAVGKGVAIPHGSDDFVYQSRICVVKLQKPINWGEEQVDIVILLALKLRDYEVTRSFFQVFHSLLEDEELLDQIRNAATGRDIQEIISQGRS
jgi:activator of the mannose operon, transcriptional antiterminator